MKAGRKKEEKDLKEDEEKTSEKKKGNAEEQKRGKDKKTDGAELANSKKRQPAGASERSRIASQISSLQDEDAGWEMDAVSARKSDSCLECVWRIDGWMPGDDRIEWRLERVCSVTCGESGQLMRFYPAGPTAKLQPDTSATPP